MCGPSVWFPVIIEWGHLRSNLYFYDYAAVQIALMLVFYVSGRQQMALIAPLAFFATAAAVRLRASRLVAIYGVLFV